MTINERMAHYKVPGVSVAFFDHGQIIWTKTYGFADVASKKPVTADTLFQAAPTRKPVAALAALRLVQEGKLSLDEDVNVKLRTWKVPENAFTIKEKVTVRRILSHSAGLTVHGFPGYASDEPVPTVVQILNGEKPANSDPIRVDVVPGTLWRYSGGGYVILQTLLSDVTGKPFPQIMSELVLRPAGMTHSTYEQPLPQNRASEVATPFRCNIETYTDSGQGFAVMTNSDSGGELTEEIFRAVAKEYGWPDYRPIEHVLIKANPATFAAYPGTYEIPGVGKLTITSKSYSLYVEAEPFGPDPQELLPESATQFFVLSGDITFTFHKDAQGAITGLTLHAGSQTFEAKKIS